MEMPFGKYKGKQIRDIDVSYLSWILNNSENLSWFLKEEIEKYVNQNKIKFEDKDEIKKIYFEMCKKHHPDKGGSNDAMKVINEFYTLLKK